MADNPRVAVLGMGNVLMGDDAAGPYVIETLQAGYEFGPGVQVLDLGTPGLDLAPHIFGLETLILVDTVQTGGSPGELRRYEKPALMNQKFRPRIGPHDPALAEALTLVELAGGCPPTVVLIGITPEKCEKGTGLSAPVQAAINVAVGAILLELHECGATVRPRRDAGAPKIWWEESVPCTS
jgi:hydrogenase maturation protease